MRGRNQRITAPQPGEAHREDEIVCISPFFRTLLDVDWLIDKFTEHYPQVFFEGEVIDFLQRQISKLEAQHWLGGKRINLSDYYVEPLVAKGLEMDQFSAKDLRTLGKQDRVPFFSLRRIALQKRRVLLLGGPSSGKSGALVRLAIEMLRDAAAQALRGDTRKATLHLPLLLTARDVLDSGSSDALLAKLGLSLTDRERVSVLMVDGLDEVTSARRQEALDTAVLFADELGASLLVTSRHIDLVKTTPSGFSRFDLLPFEANQAMKLFGKLLEGRKELLDALRTGLERIRFNIPMFPLSLIFLLDLVEEKKEIPASLTELYDRFSDMALGRWDKEKGIEVLFEYLVKKKFLAVLSFTEMLTKGRMEIPQLEFTAFLRSYADLYEWDETYEANFRRELERTGVLELGETVLFKHRSFRDYFGGFYIFDQHDKIDDYRSLIVALHFDDNWGDTAFFAIGLKREISGEILDRIFAREGDDARSFYGKLAVGRLLQAGWHSTPHTKRHGIESALSYAPQLRNSLEAVLDENDRPLPPLYPDVVTFFVADTFFNSGFLSRDMKAVLDKTLGMTSAEAVFQSILAIGCLRQVMSASELKEAVRQCEELLPRVGSIEQQARLLLLLMIIQRDEKAVFKRLQTRALTLAKRYPDIIRQVIGAPQRPPRLPQGKT